MTGLWEDLIGTAVAGRFKLRSLTYDGRDQAEFAAAGPGPDEEPVTVTLLRPARPEDARLILSEMQATCELQHPNILRTIDAGRFDSGGDSLLYLVTERADETLAEAVKRGFRSSAIPKLASDILAALQFLHARSEAYCNLDPDTTVRVGEDWKLADLSRVCHDGTPGAQVEGARYTPPEARSGAVSTAWDVWAFGKMMQALLAHISAERVPAPISAAIESAASADPRKRPSVPGLQAVFAPEEPEEPEERPRSWFRQPVTALIAVVCLAVVGLWMLKSKLAPAAAPAPVEDVAKPVPTPVVAKPSAMGGSARRAPAPAPEKHESPAPSHTVEGLADYSGSDMNGRRTANGERFDSNALTAAAKGFRLGARLRVTNPANGRSVVVKVNDRGRFRNGHVIRLTRRAATDLGIAGAGSARVRVEPVK